MHSKQLLQLIKPLGAAVEETKSIPSTEYINFKDGYAYTTNLALSIRRKVELPNMMLPYHLLISALSVIDAELQLSQPTIFNF